MSLKHTAERVSDAHYVLPRVGTMRVDAHAFFSDALYSATDEVMWQQLADAASYQGVRGAYLMPDAHVGYGVPVGCVVVTDGTLIQAASGYDISCGVAHLTVPGLSASAVASRGVREAFVAAVERRIATGMGSHRAKLARRISPRLTDDILRYGAQAVGVGAGMCERQFIEVPDDVALDDIPAAYDKAAVQLGSVGGGNHFVELQLDQESGQAWVMIHCGSRGYGYQTANHFFYEGARLRGLPKQQREASWLYADEPLGRAYWAHHNSAANYAIANRHLIVAGVNEALEEVFQVRGELYYEISHNLVQEETLLLPDGTTDRGLVHRKGATRAFPAGHPDLAGTRWSDTGHPCLIPGSMYEGAAILFAGPCAHASGYSVNHGSGRKLARGEAKRALADQHGAIDREMREVQRELGGVLVRGIVGNTPRTPLDECAHVYKNLDEVLGVLESEGIARVAHRLYPVANIKGDG